MQIICLFRAKYVSFDFGLSFPPAPAVFLAGVLLAGIQRRSLPRRKTLDSPLNHVGMTGRGMDELKFAYKFVFSAEY
jgi:hypothetical protein